MTNIEKACILSLILHSYFLILFLLLHVSVSPCFNLILLEEAIQ